jgi:hypothetical protein
VDNKKRDDNNLSIDSFEEEKQLKRVNNKRDDNNFDNFL